MIEWHKQPKDTNYPAAESYLSLIFDPIVVELYIEHLKEAKLTSFKAKDIFRASGLPQLGRDNFHVAANLRKMEDGHKLSPILLIRDTDFRKVIIADGYHRMCAVHLKNEDADIFCKIA